MNNFEPRMSFCMAHARARSRIDWRSFLDASTVHLTFFFFAFLSPISVCFARFILYRFGKIDRCDVVFGGGRCRSFVQILRDLLLVLDGLYRDTCSRYNVWRYRCPRIAFERSRCKWYEKDSVAADHGTWCGRFSASARRHPSVLSPFCHLITNPSRAQCFFLVTFLKFSCNQPTSRHRAREDCSS